MVPLILLHPECSCQVMTRNQSTLSLWETYSFSWSQLSLCLIKWIVLKHVVLYWQFWILNLHVIEGRGHWHRTSSTLLLLQKSTVANSNIVSITMAANPEFLNQIIEIYSNPCLPSTEKFNFLRNWCYGTFWDRGLQTLSCGPDLGYGLTFLHVSAPVASTSVFARMSGTVIKVGPGSLGLFLCDEIKPWPKGKSQCNHIHWEPGNWSQLFNIHGCIAKTFLHLPWQTSLAEPCDHHHNYLPCAILWNTSSGITTTGLKALLYKRCADWSQLSNSCPGELRINPSLTVFQQQIKMFLF